MPKIKFEVDAELVDILKELTGITSDQQLGENAFMFLGWGAAEVAKGKTIASVAEAKKTYQEVEIPAFKNIKDKLAAEAKK